MSKIRADHPAGAKCGQKRSSLHWVPSCSFGACDLFPTSSNVLTDYRFISPAVVSPETVDVELPRENSLVIRRGLMVVTKVIQNLANNIFFGKEAYMVVLNKFLKDNIDNVTRYLSELNVRVYFLVPFTWC